MAGELLKNTCFHEINVAGIPDNTNITRIVSVNGNEATMHTRLANADADAFEPKIINGARLFLITSYSEDKAVIDAATDIKAKTDERQDIKLEQTSAAGGYDIKASRDAAQDAYVAKKQQVDEAARAVGMTEVDLDEANKFLGTDELLKLLTVDNKTNEEIKELVAAEKAAAEASGMAGGKRTRRRKNHGSKRRNASNKSGRRASKQSRRRGKKQSKRHGRK